MARRIARDDLNFRRNFAKKATEEVAKRVDPRSSYAYALHAVIRVYLSCNAIGSCFACHRVAGVITTFGHNGLDACAGPIF